MRSVPFCSLPLSVCAALTVAAMTAPAGAEWVVANLHPPAATESAAFGVSVSAGEVQVVGYASLAGVPHASLWGRTAASWVDLNPPGTFSFAYGTDGAHQVGVVGSPGRAALWAGAAASHVSLHPPLIHSSAAYGVAGGRQVGTAGSSTVQTARIWAGSPANVDLLVVGIVNGTDGTQEVGSGIIDGLFPRTEALLWSGTAASLISLHPSHLRSSSGLGVSAGQQVGLSTAALGAPAHAALWTGTAASFVDLHPAGAVRSEARAVSNGVQAGLIAVADANDPNSTVEHAAIWTGTAASCMDLHPFVPTGFRTSRAEGVWSDGDVTHVAGSGFNQTTGRAEALLWTLATTPPCPADLDGNGTVDVFDLLAYLSAWFSNLPEAERTGDNPPSVDVFDLLDYLGAWFAGC